MMYESIEKRIDAIKVAGVDEDDDEVAHGLEDELYEAFIQSIANDGRIPRDFRMKAKLVLSTKNIKFRRWCS